MGAQQQETERQPEWVTWQEAAALVGCPVPTIDWYSRLGRIEKRPFHGSRPSLRRASVEAFAKWWAKDQTQRSTRRAQRVRRPSGPRQPPVVAPPGHLSSRDAAEIADVSQSHIPWLIAGGHLVAVRDRGRWWVREDSVKRLASERRDWISYAGAARLIGSSTSVVQQAIRAGELRQRSVSRALPSISRSSAIAFGEEWRRRQSERHAQAQLRAQERLGGPPDAEHRWHPAKEVASMLGISRSRVDQLARADRLPFTRHRGRRWYRSDHIAMLAAARRFASEAESAGSQTA